MIKRLLREAAWAPAAVLVLSVIVGRTPFAREAYWAVHLLAGAALAFFFLRASDVLRAARPLARYVFAFALALSTALGWELAEFAIDQMLATALQEDLAETMSDLLFGVCGAAAYLGYAALRERPSASKG